MPKLPFNVTYRVCRATYGSFLIAQDIPVAVSSRFLGHTSVEITERWYFGLAPTQYTDLVDKAFSEGIL